MYGSGVYSPPSKSVKPKYDSRIYNAIIEGAVTFNKNTRTPYTKTQPLAYVARGQMLLFSIWLCYSWTIPARLDQTFSYSPTACALFYTHTHTHKINIYSHTHPNRKLLGWKCRWNILEIKFSRRFFLLTKQKKRFSIFHGCCCCCWEKKNIHFHFRLMWVDEIQIIVNISCSNQFRLY